MAKKIILLSELYRKFRGKLGAHQRLARVRAAGPERFRSDIAAYDDGVGSSSFRPLALLGGVFGWGLKRNVLSLYKFLCRNYRSAEDYIALGEANPRTTRSTASIQPRGLHDAGRHRPRSRSGAGQVRRRERVRFPARAAYRLYQHRRYSKVNLQFIFRAVRIWFDKGTYQPRQKSIKEIEFLGLWDTVSAYGLPIDEMTRGVSQWLWPLELPSKTFNHSKIKRARHALSVDDERATFNRCCGMKMTKIRNPPALSDQPATNSCCKCGSFE